MARSSICSPWPSEVEKRIDKAKALGVQSGEAKLLVMAALLMADELHDMTLELQAAAQGQAAARRSGRSRSASRGSPPAPKRLPRRSSNTR